MEALTLMGQTIRVHESTPECKLHGCIICDNPNTLIAINLDHVKVPPLAQLCPWDDGNPPEPVIACVSSEAFDALERYCHERSGESRRAYVAAADAGYTAAEFYVADKELSLPDAHALHMHPSEGEPNGDKEPR